MNEPAFGDQVLVRPSHPQLRVQRREDTYGQFLTVDWSEVLWDHYFHRRLRDGSIEWKLTQDLSDIDDTQEHS